MVASALQQTVMGTDSLNVTISQQISRVTVELIRPNDTTAYQANDVIADSASAASPLLLSDFFETAGGNAYLTGAALTTNKKSIAPRIRVHLYNDIPTMANDNAPHLEKYADVGKRLGFFDLPGMVTAADNTNSDTSRAADYNLRIPLVGKTGSRSIYVVFEVLDAFTPNANQKFTLTLLADWA